MVTEELDIEKARFDSRLPKEQKKFFERAATLGGYRNLTDFILMAAQNKAQEIISQKERVLASQRDSEIFFDAITNPIQPNENLTEAANEFKALLSK